MKTGPIRTNAFLACLLLAAGAAVAEDICDFTLNPEARDGHSPADPGRFFEIPASSHYEAHPSTVMLPDDRTILAFWDVQQGGPCGPAAVSKDAGRTWTRIDGRIPKEFAACHDEPKAYRFVDPKTGRGRIRVFASYGLAEECDWRGADERPLAEAMPSIVSEDDGQTWKMLPPLGTDFACVVGFSGMVRLEDGSYLGVFSQGRNPNGDGGEYRVMGSLSRDGGLNWGKPFVLAKREGCSFFMPTIFRSPDGRELCCLANDVNGGMAWTSRSRDGGRTWSEPAQANDGLAGAEHAVSVLADGRVAVAFHCGEELLGLIGSYESIRARKGEGTRRMRLVHNYGDFGMVGSPNLHVRKNGEIVVIAHSLLDLRRTMPSVVAMRFAADEVDRHYRERADALTNFEGWNPFAGTSFRPLGAAKLYGPFAQQVVMIDKENCTLSPFNGKKEYIEKAAGPKAREIVSQNGSYDIAKHADRRVGNAAILVWTVRVPEDCRARLRFVGSPIAFCCVGEKPVLTPVHAGIFDLRTAEISLKKGDNDISMMVFQPQDRAAERDGYKSMPMRVAAALDLKAFECIGGGTLEIKDEEEPSLDDALDL